MANKGWIKLWRKLLDSDMYAELTSKQRDVMIQCLLLANHKEKQWEWQGELYKCESGQFKTSLENLRKHCADDVSMQNVRTTLLKLEKWQFLTNQSTKSGRIITICNWLIHQSEDIEINKDTNKELTKSQQRANKELTSNKNDKELKNDKETITKEIVKEIKKEYLDVAALLGELILERKPDYQDVLKVKAEGWIKWGDVIRLMIERDNRKIERIREVIEWCQQDDFWQNNILSTSKLRIQFDKLELDMIKKPTKKSMAEKIGLERR